MPADPPRPGAGRPRGVRDAGRDAGRGGAGRARAERPDRPHRPRPPAAPAGPALPADADPALLDRALQTALRSLAPAAAEEVARRLVATGQLIDTDPLTAYAHAQVAKRLAGRVGAVREAVGIAAYRAGDYAAALQDLRAARRMTGADDLLPTLADCERALGRPEKALELAASPEASRLGPAERVELTIVASGARRDLGQPQAALLELEGAHLDSGALEPWSLRLWYAYADALLAAGRLAEAREWFGAVAAADEDDETDAAERLAVLAAPEDPDST